MKIPSYDDLAPSISDVHPRDTFNFAARVVQHVDEPVVRAALSQIQTASGQLFACVQTRGHAVQPGAPVLSEPRRVEGPVLSEPRARRVEGMLSLARDFSPRIERYGDDVVVLDAAGLGRLLGDGHGIAAELQRTATDRGLKVQLAVATTQTAARILAAVAEEPRVVVTDVASALSPLPLGLLAALSDPAERPINTVAHARFFDTLARWGLRTIGELAGLPADEIAARFGAIGVALHRRALGLDARPLLPDPSVPRFIQSMELEWPIEELEPLSFVLARLLDPLSTALERADKGAAAIRIDLRLVDKTTHTRMLQLPAAMRDARVLRTLLLLDLESHPPSAGIDVVTVEVDPAPGRIVQFSLLEHATPSPETVATLTARLHALVGEDRCGSPVLVDSHRPDAFTLTRFGSKGLAAPRSAPPANDTATSAERPAVLRRFRPPVAIRVTVDRGRPLHIPIDRKGIPGGRVAQSAGPWRSSGAWWDHDHAWDRDEWDVEFVDGCVCRVFQVRETGGWFMEGVVD